MSNPEDGMDLTFADIEPRLVELMADRAALIDEWESQPAEMLLADTGEFVEALAFRNAAIAAYLKASVKKADGCAAMLLWMESRILAQQAEENRVYALRKSTEAERDFLEACVMEAMHSAGKRLVPGLRHTLKLNRNPPAVVIAQPELVPRTYHRVTVTMSACDWERIVVALPWVGKEIDGAMKSDIPKPPVAAVLKLREKCPECDGTKLTVTEDAEVVRCPRCEGKGTIPGAGVPGCRLESSDRLEVL